MEEFLVLLLHSIGTLNLQHRILMIYLFYFVFGFHLLIIEKVFSYFSMKFFTFLF